MNTELKSHQEKSNSDNQDLQQKMRDLIGKYENEFRSAKEEHT